LLRRNFRILINEDIKWWKDKKDKKNIKKKKEKSRT